VNEARFVEDTVFAEGAIEGATETGAEGLVVQRARDVALVEEGYHFVYREVLVFGIAVWGKVVCTSSLEACDMLADGLDGTSSV
jgi:hypothetical protein